METFVPDRNNIHGPIMPLFILDKKITSGAKIMYAILCSYASLYNSDYCYPSKSKLAERLSCSVSSVKNYLAELVGVKLIAVERRHNGSSRYYMLRPPVFQTAMEGKHEAKIAPQQPKITDVQPKFDYINNFNKQNKENTPPLPPAQVSRSLSPASGLKGGGGIFVHEFEKAWAAYPKKEAMGLAHRAWNKLRQHGQLPPLPDILAAIDRFISTEKWKREHGRFIPQMSNFLDGLRWLDPLSPEEEEAARLSQARERLALAYKREQDAREAESRAQHERLRPIYEAFKAKFPMEMRRDTLEAMLYGRWHFLHDKFGGPTAADVPDGNTRNMNDFMTDYERRRDAAECVTRLTPEAKPFRAAA